MRPRIILFWLAVFLIIFLFTVSIKRSVTVDTNAETPVTIDESKMADYSNVSSESGTLQFFITGDETSIFTSSQSDMQAVSDFIEKKPELQNSDVKGVFSDGEDTIVGTKLFPADFSRNLRVIRATEEMSGKKHYYYRQTIDGTPVFGAMFAAHLANGHDIYSVSGNLLAHTAHVSAVLSPADAGQKAIEVASREKPIETLAIRSNKDIFFNGKLVGISEDSTTYPAAEVIISDMSEPVQFAFRYVVSRLDGSILYSESIVDEALDRLIYNCDGGLSNCPSVRHEGSSPVGNQDVDNTYTYLGDVYNFYKNTFGRDGYDNKGSQSKAFVNLTTQTQCPNALWAKAPYSQLVFCKGMAAQDVVAHEYTHGVTEHSANLLSSNQPGALNEAISDIMATGVDPDWKMGEDTSLGVIRSADDPPSDPRGAHPDRLFSQFYSCSANDNGGVHTNSTVISKAFYLMSEGGSFNGCNLVGIGKPASLQIWYRALTLYLIETSNFNYAYRSVLQACSDLYGQNSTECGRTASALQAVEIDQQPTNGQTGASCTGVQRQPPACANVSTPTNTPTPSLTVVPTITPTVTPIGCPKKSSGDTNCDGVINLSDFETWRKEYLKLVNTNTADFDGDGQSTLADFQIWRGGYFAI